MPCLVSRDPCTRCRLHGLDIDLGSPFLPPFVSHLITTRSVKTYFPLPQRKKVVQTRTVFYRRSDTGPVASLSQDKLGAPISIIDPHERLVHPTSRVNPPGGSPASCS